MIAKTIPNLHIQCSEVGSQQVYLGCNARSQHVIKPKISGCHATTHIFQLEKKNGGTTRSPRGKTFIVSHSELLDTKKT